MNQCGKHTKNIDCFRPWQTNRNNSYSPVRHPKIPTNLHRSAFADSCNNQNDSLHSVFLNHLRQQLPKTVANQTITIHKRGKDNRNLSIKENYAHPKLKSVYFEDSSNKFCSSSESDLSSNLNSTPCRMQNVRNVIEKFNRLGANQTNINSKHEFNNKIASKQSFKDSNRIGKNIDSRVDITSKQNENEKYDGDIKDFVRIIASKQSNNFVEERREQSNEKLNDYKQKNKRREHYSIELRSQRFHKEKANSRIICDDLLQIFVPKDETEKNISKTEMDGVGKELVSTQTQTTPCSSATNIMINVYDRKSPRLLKYSKVNPMEIRISQEDKQNTKVEKKEFEVTKRSVRACIKQFEDHLTKKGINFERGMTDSKIFSKIRSEYLLKQEYEPKLSPKARSVPF